MKEADSLCRNGNSNREKFRSLQKDRESVTEYIYHLIIAREVQSPHGMSKDIGT